MRIKAPKRQTPLSNKPSVALRQALSDLKWVEKSKRFDVDMDWWVTSYSSVCEVCLAGSVLIRRTKYAQEIIDTNFGDQVICEELIWEQSKTLREKMYALNNARSARWEHFIRRWPSYKKQMKKALTWLPEFSTYEQDPKEFKAGLLKAAKVFEKHGC